MNTTSKDYLAYLEKRKVETGGWGIPTLDEWRMMIDMSLAEREQEDDMKRQSIFDQSTPASKRHDWRTLPVEGSRAHRKWWQRRWLVIILFLLSAAAGVGVAALLGWAGL